MSLREQISQDMKTAMKAKDSATLSTLRLLQSALKNKQIEEGGELNQKQIQSVIKKEVKKLKDSLTSFRDAGRDEQVANIQKEIDVLEAYLPEQLSDEEVSSIVQGVIDDVGAESMSDMGRVMGEAMKRVEGRADGNRVKNAVQKILKVFVFAAILSLSIVEPIHAAAPIFPGTSNRALFEYMLRIGRVVFMFAGIFSINLILKGGFAYMTGGARHETRQNAIRNVTSGVFGSFVIMFLFTWATVALQRFA